MDHLPQAQTAAITIINEIAITIKDCKTTIIHFEDIKYTLLMVLSVKGNA